jgi:hypothetical protein
MGRYPQLKGKKKNFRSQNFGTGSIDNDFIQYFYLLKILFFIPVILARFIILGLQKTYIFQAQYKLEMKFPTPNKLFIEGFEVAVLTLLRI